ncbi:glycine-rich domain-containing protein [Geofilum sp. OHC36d9]|uniref:glycine-rich domain-containing protein n=1 Tax=Geofilum sp. OHC36d9 TaxID=3458413 RepID=UPI004034D0B6
MNNLYLNLLRKSANGTRLSDLLLMPFRLIAVVTFMWLLGSSSFAQTDEVVTKSSSGNFTVPDGVTTITVEVWGAGGGGGGSSYNRYGGSGGGGGGYTKGILTVTPGATINYTVGDGGSAGARNGRDGGDGGFSVFGSLTATGGGGGGGNRGTAGVGGSGSGGNINNSGDSGDTGGNWSGVGGAGANGGAGGASIRNNEGEDGSVPGGGGSGGEATNRNSYAGGAGGDGQIVITYTPGYRAEISGVDVGSTIWEVGESRSVTMTVTNTGQATWNTGDVQVIASWNDGTQFSADAGGLVQDASATYLFSVTAPSVQSTENITFSIVRNGMIVAEITSEQLNVVPSITRYYSYKSGDWNEPTTWTHDPSGTTQVCETVPNEYAEVYVLAGRTVTLPGDVGVSNLNISIADGGVLDMSTHQFSSGLLYLRGQGTLRLASLFFPSATTNTFVDESGGTTEYYNNANFEWGTSSQGTYCNLVLNASGVTASQMRNITINGNLVLKNGTFSIGNSSSTVLRSLIVKGDLQVYAGAQLKVGAGSTSTDDLSGSVIGSYPDYYINNSHRVELYGDFTNNGTVRFTNQTMPDYNSFPDEGFATVFFRGASDNTLYCNGTTDFYNLVLDKGSDQTFKLTVNSTTYSHFRLFGRTDQGGEDGGTDPSLKKALWIKTGTLSLEGLTVIPSLTEGNSGGNPNSDYFIPANGALELNGPEVIVLSTADSYQEINAAYGVSATSNNDVGLAPSGGAQSFSIYGKLVINDGYLSTRESGGIITWDVASGQLEINGGYLDTKQIRAAGGSEGKFSYQQAGGTVALRGRYQRTPSAYTSVSDLRANTVATINTAINSTVLDGSKATFNVNSATNVFIMSGGTIQIYDVSGDNGYAVDIYAGVNNINVTGGTIEFLPLTGSTDFIIRSNAPFGNMVLNRSAGTSTLTLGSGYPLTILKNITLTKGIFSANSEDVTVGGNFTVSADATYNSGTNTTTFNGSGNQLFTVNGIINNGAAGLNNLTVTKSGGYLKMAGSNALTVLGDFDLAKGAFNDGGLVLSVAGNVVNSGIHTGDGSILLNGSSAQTISGDGDGIFQNLTLINTNSDDAPVSLAANTTVNGVLTFGSDKHLNIGIYNLKMGADASFNSADASSYVRTAGTAGDGGITMTYDAVESKVFPVGVADYTPATLGFSSAPDTYGTVTVVPVNYEHTVTSTKGISLSYFWRVKSEGITGFSGKVTHSFEYNQSNVAGTESNYVPAVYDATNYTWSYGSTANVDATNNVIADWTSPTQSSDFLNGDYTAGASGAFGTPTIFYSRQTGLWGDRDTWSTTGHDGSRASSVPGEGDVVIIGDGDTVSLDRTERNTWWGDDWNTKDEDVRNCASLQIEAGGVLDVKYSPSSNFGMVLSHPNGNGLLRVSTQYSSGGIFEFPNGDFSEFNTQLGTTELYTINEVAGTTYWLPSDVDNYGNLTISPAGGANIIFGNTDLTIYGNLVTHGSSSESWFLPTWNSNYPEAPYARKAKTIAINGNLDIQGGALIFYGNYNFAQNFVIDGDLIVGESSGIMVYSNAYSQSIKIGGDLINNASFGGGENAYRGCNFTDIPLTFFGDDNALVTNESGSPSTIFDEVTVNKGSSQATTLTIDIEGDLETPVNDWLTLENGTLKYERNNPNSDFSITTSSTFTIPPTAGLWIDYVKGSNNKRVLLANGNSNTNDVYLNGKLTVVNGDVYVGPVSAPNYNNDIEYSGGGASAIDVRGGQLVINGQIRRNVSTNSGILSYTQSGGEVIINGRNANTTNAKLEVLNTGSKFNMSGGTLTLIRGGGGDAYGDLYLRPAASSVTGGGIIFANEESGYAATYLLDANVPLNNITVTGYEASDLDATVELLVSPLTLNGDLILSNVNSIFDANSNFNINLTINGDFENNGSYNHYENLTTFGGGTQELRGSSSTSFYDLKMSSVTSLTFNKDVTVYNDMELASGAGSLLLDANTVTLNGDLINKATFVSQDAAGGVMLSGGSEEHQISGTGTFDRLELNDLYGARLLNQISMNRNLVLTSGVFNINKYLLSLGQNAIIEGSNFSSSKMISSDGVYSNVGIRKLFPKITSATSFTFPMGLGSKYTPAVLNINNNGTAGYIRVNTINSKHPSAMSPYRVLNYYWEVENTGISGFSGELYFHYSQDDVMQDNSDEGNYVAARLLTPSTSWSKASAGAGTDNVDEANNVISFSGLSDVNGEYTAGLDEDIPDEVPTYEANVTGDWNDASIWTPVGTAPDCPDGGPNGAVVIINSEVSVTENYRFAYKTIINSKLIIDKDTYGHNLGLVEGSGTLYMEDALMPAGRYTAFFDCSGDATLELGGNSDYNIVADLFTAIPNLKISGSGSRILPNVDLTVCHSLVIDGATLDNSVNNKKLNIKGTFERYNGGRFIAGSGSNATVSFAGDAAQTVGGATGNFDGDNAFYNLEIANASGLTLNGATDVSGKLMLTNGLIHTESDAPLTVTNTSSNSVSPAGGTATSYVDGPMIKRISQGSSFNFPVGDESALGNKLTLTASQTGTVDWTVTYFSPNDTYAQYASPLTYVNSKEYWDISATSGNAAVVNIDWDDVSDITPLITVSGTDDMRVASYNATSSQWNEVASSASGTDYDGTVSSASRIEIPVSGSISVTTATVNTVKPKAKFTPTGDLCGETSGIPVTFTSSDPIGFDYVLTYSIDGVEQAPVTVSAVPYVLPTDQAGDYQLISFSYNTGAATGAVDKSVVTVYATPTAAIAGADISLCGDNEATLAANSAVVGTGLWTIISGDGGTVINPTSADSEFRGVNGNAYVLRWTISNGACKSWDDVSVVFPLLAAQPGEFITFDSEVCGGSEDVSYVVPLDATVNYIWSYSGSGVTVNDTDNSALLTFENDATGGTLSVTAENSCNTSAARELEITVNPVSSVTLTSDDDDNVFCVNNQATFTAQTSEGSWSSFDFQMDGSSVQDGSFTSVAMQNLLDNQKIVVVGQTDKGCKVVSNEITVTVNAVPGLWIGNADSDWSNSENWCSDVVPASGSDVTIASEMKHPAVISTSYDFNDLTINAGGLLTLTLGSKVNVNGDLTIKAEGGLVLENTTGADGLASLITNGSVTGKAKVRLTLPTNQWYYLASPMKNATFADFGAEYEGAKVYLERGGWIKYDASATNPTIENVEGALVKYTNSESERTIEYTGTLNSEEVARTLDVKKYYLFGNPYPASLNWQDESWARPNIQGTLWYRTRVNEEMAFVTYNRFAPEYARAALYPDDVSMFNEEELALIPPYQSAWIYVEGTTSVNFVVSPSQRSHGLSGSLLKSSSVNKSSSSSDVDVLRIVSANTSSRDGAVVYFSDEATVGSDAGDSPKYFNSSTKIPEVYTTSEGLNFAINGLPKFEGPYDLPLVVRNRVAGEVTLTFELSKYYTDDVIELKDNLLDKTVNLRETNEYTYTPVTLGTNSDRFTVRFNAPPTEGNDDDVTTGIEDLLGESDVAGINIVGVNGRAIVSIDRKLLTNGPGSIEVYTVSGSKVSEFKANTNKTFIVLPENSGVYLVVVKANGLIESKKLVR